MRHWREFGWGKRRNYRLTGIGGKSDRVTTALFSHYPGTPVQTNSRRGCRSFPPFILTLRDTAFEGVIRPIILEITKEVELIL